MRRISPRLFRKIGSFRRNLTHFPRKGTGEYKEKLFRRFSRIRSRSLFSSETYRANRNISRIRSPTHLGHPSESFGGAPTECDSVPRP
jgi:hypothetical protein